MSNTRPSTGWPTWAGAAHTSPDIALDSPGTELGDYGQAVLERRLRDALASLNPSLLTSAAGAVLPSSVI